MNPKKIFLLDASSYVFRAYHAVSFLTNSKSFPTNAIYGFVNMFKDRSKTNAFLVTEIEHLRTQGIPFMLCRLRNYTLFEEIDTRTSYYDVNANNKAKLNFTVWINEFVKTLKHG